MKVRTTPLEWLAVGSAIALFVAGFAMGYFGESAWLNRFGSLIIVVGIIITAIKVSDILTQQIAQFLAQNHQKKLDDVIDANRSFFGGRLPPGYKEKLEEDINKKVFETFATYKQKRVDRVKRVEVGVLVFGTLTNGFGDYLLGLFKVAAACNCVS